MEGVRGVFPTVDSGLMLESLSTVTAQAFCGAFKEGRKRRQRPPAWRPRVYANSAFVSGESSRRGSTRVAARGVLLCFINTDAEGIKGTEGFPRGHRTQTVSAYFRRWLRRALLFLTDHSRSPGTTIRVQSGVLHLLGLVSGVRRGGKGIPISSLVVEMDRLLRPAPKSV